MSIRVKLVLCSLAMLLPLAVLGIASINLLDRQLAQRTQESLTNTLRLEATRITEILNGYKQNARNLATRAHVVEFVKACNDSLSAQAKGAENADVPNRMSRTVGGENGYAIIDPSKPWALQQLALSLQQHAGINGSHVAELRIVDTQGTILGETIGFSWHPADAELLSASIASAEIVFGDTFVNDAGHQRLGMIAPIVVDSGVVVGALMLETRLTWITRLMSPYEDYGLSNDEQMTPATVGQSAPMITSLRFDSRAEFVETMSAERYLPIDQALVAPDSRILYATDYRGVDSILAIKTLPDTGWELVVKVNADDAMGPAKAIRELSLVTTIAATVFMLTGYLFGLLPIANRLQKTATVASRVMNGDLTARVADAGQDELGHLARTIDALACDLEADQRMRTVAEEKLRYQALHDELTGLYNRKHANSIMKRLSDQTDGHHSIMFIDLNGFKDINDLYGHAIGDSVLKQVAKRLQSRLDAIENVTLARWGGDEFVVILPNHDEESATAVAMELHNVFDEPIKTSADSHSLTCSIGLANSSGSRPLDEALLEADIQMYEQKKRQKRPRSKTSMAVRTVERALIEDRTEVWFQPIVKLDMPGQFELCGAEALVRIRSRGGGMVMPREFLDEVNEVEAGAELDRRVMAHSLRSLARWQADGIVNQHFRLSVNLTARTMENPAFSTLLGNQLQEAGVHPHSIVIELPHDAQLDPLHVSHLRMLGVSVALDRIGGDASRLSRSSPLHAEIVKIDRRWLADPVVAPHLISICRDLGLKLIVEGIETREQLAELLELGVCCFQGALLDSPQRPSDFICRWGEFSLETIGARLNRNAQLKNTG